MKNYNNVIIFLATIIGVVSAYDPIKSNQLNLNRLFVTNQTAHISPEIINELKDFENLIPSATIDKIIAEHYLIDGNFRTALKYLRSQKFSQLQKQLLNVPEIVYVLEFLHLTTTNATTRQMGATSTPTTARVMASLDAYNDDAAADSYNKVNKMTANTGTIDSKPNTMATKEALNNLNVPKRPQQQFYIKEENNKNDRIDYDGTTNANFVASNQREPLVHIVLLEDIEVKAKFYNKRHHSHHHHHHKYTSPCKNCYHHGSLGTFTSFVEEVLQHLPHSAYQNMIHEKCEKNPKFAEFYQSLKSAEFKPLIENMMMKDNIKKIIEVLGSHDVDVNSLVPIAFKVISWGPSI